jgi:hypothetical protein
MRKPAPIAVFVYRRAGHARRMLHSLLQNRLAAESPICIFCDGPRSERDAPEVGQTRAAVSELVPAHARIVERSANLGLARSVIEGVSAMLEEYGEVIVVEDDLVLSPFALDYFNQALERYRNEERVMHVSGYMFPVKAALPEAFFYREATCWGWATWARAWQHFEPDGNRIRRAVLERGERRAFDVEGSIGFFEMLESQIAGRVDSWAIRWYGSLWMRGGLALHPGNSLVRNTGLDGSGEHCGVTSAFDVDLGAAPVRVFPDEVVENADALRAVVAYRKAMTGANRLGRWRELWRRLIR